MQQLGAADQQVGHPDTRQLGLRQPITPAAAQVVPADEATRALRRHAAGDWGNVDSEDWASNDEALRKGTRLLSSYQTQDKTVFWIITEADRSVTTILLPSDY